LRGGTRKISPQLASSSARKYTRGSIRTVLTEPRRRPCAHASAIETTANGAAKGGRAVGARLTPISQPQFGAGRVPLAGASAAKREVNIFRLGRTSETGSSTPRAATPRASALLSDAECREDAVEDIVGGGGAGYGVERA
jgi:hypothetical protein